MATISKPSRLKLTHIQLKIIALTFRFPLQRRQLTSYFMSTQQLQIKPKLRYQKYEKDPLDCFQNLLMNTMVVNNHIFSTSKLKLQKYKRSHDNARANGSRSNASIVSFAVDTLSNFCSVAITFLKAVAKIKFAKISNIAKVKGLAASN